MINKILISMLFLLGGIMPVSSQTYLYKRVMVVKNGNKTNKNDDAHYITFNRKGFYESDKNGYKNANSSFVEFIKDQNDLHCYFGNGYYGENHYYFSRDYSRMNVKIDKTVTYVYQRELSGKTTASRRKLIERNSPNVAPILTSTMSSSSSSSTISSNSSSHSDSRTESRYGYVTCTHCYGGGNCATCLGRGLSLNSYTGEYMDCPNCTDGKCSFCNGTGKRYGLK